VRHFTGQAILIFTHTNHGVFWLAVTDTCLIIIPVFRFFNENVSAVKALEYQIITYSLIKFAVVKVMETEVDDSQLSIAGLLENEAPHHEDMLGGWRYSSALDGSEWSASHPSHFTPSTKMGSLLKIKMEVSLKRNSVILIISKTTKWELPKFASTGFNPLQSTRKFL
jgi:hypothetical protein